MSRYTMPWNQAPVPVKHAPLHNHRSSTPLAMLLAVGLIGLAGPVATGTPEGRQRADTSGTNSRVTSRDILTDTLAPFNELTQRRMFLRSTGVDAELDAEEFAGIKALHQRASKSNEPVNDRSPRGAMPGNAKPGNVNHAFLQPFDHWHHLHRFDKDSNGSIDWFEFRSYRTVGVKVLLQHMDRNHDRKLTGPERAAALKAFADGWSPWQRKQPAPKHQPHAEKPSQAKEREALVDRSAIYKKLLDEVSEMDRDTLSKLLDKDAQIDGQIVAELAKLQPLLKRIREAANGETPDFHLDFKDGPGLVLTHIGPMRTMTQLLALDAKHKIARGETPMAVENLSAMLKLADHHRSDGTIIGQLVGVAAKTSTTQIVNINLDQFNDLELKDLRDALGEQSELTHASRAVAQEGAWMTAWLRAQFNDPKNAKNAKNVQEIPPLLRAQLANPVQREKLLGELEDRYQQVAQLIAEPHDAYLKGQAELDRDLKTSTNPLVKLVMPSLGGVRRSADRSDTRVELVKAAIDYRRQGRNAADRVLDPISGKPFKVRQAQGRVTLIGTAKDDGKPMSITFDLK